MAASTNAVAHAKQMFTKHGNSQNVHFVRECIAGVTLGLFGGLTWKQHRYLLQIYHWNEKRKIEEYYHTLAKMEKDKLSGPQEEIE
eukprot:jgi/Astpho2/7434/Aster-x0318